MIILLKLILAHIVGDFILQSNKCVSKKEEQKIKSPSLYLHALVHGTLVLMILWDLKYYPLALLIMIIHLVIDLSKLYFQKENNASYWFFIDQGAHLLSIVALWSFFFKPDFNFKPFINETEILIYSVAILFITIVSAIVMRELMTKWSESLNELESGSLKNAGKYIGILERLFVFTFILTGHWEGIGFLLAAKSVFRFGDLKESKDRKLTEYILIGTLLSFGIAIGAGLIVLKLLNIE